MASQLGFLGPGHVQGASRATAGTAAGLASGPDKLQATSSVPPALCGMLERVLPFSLPSVRVGLRLRQQHGSHQHPLRGLPWWACLGLLERTGLGTVAAGLQAGRTPCQTRLSCLAELKGSYPTKSLNRRRDCDSNHRPFLCPCRQFESLARKLIAAHTKGGHHGGLLSRRPFRCFSAMSKHLPDPKQVRQRAASGAACGHAQQRCGASAVPWGSNAPCHVAPQPYNRLCGTTLCLWMVWGTP